MFFSPFSLLSNIPDRLRRQRLQKLLLEIKLDISFRFQLVKPSCSSKLGEKRANTLPNFSTGRTLKICVLMWFHEDVPLRFPVAGLSWTENSVAAVLDSPLCPAETTLPVAYESMQKGY